MDDNFINKIVELHQQGNWREIVSKYHDHPEKNKLLWVYPSEENLVFLKTTLQELHCESLLSVGCGSGLLEWIISEATGLAVKGIEVDGAWWRCKYAPPSFIPLLFTTPSLDKDTTCLLQNGDMMALMFCYFNNREAFEDYLRIYSGNVLVIIGPGLGKGVHTDPLPFGGVNEKWTLYKWQEVRSSMDFIAVYRRSSNA